MKRILSALLVTVMLFGAVAGFIPAPSTTRVLAAEAESGDYLELALKTSYEDIEDRLNGTPLLDANGDIKYDSDNKQIIVGAMTPMLEREVGGYKYRIYANATTGEIIYTKEKNRPVEHYTCANDDDMIQMEMVLWEKVEGSWVRTFGRPYERQWWHTGFVWGNMIGRNKDLQMRARITMRDFEMLDAVVKAFKEKGFKEVSLKITDFLKNPAVPTPDSFFVNGLDIYFYWTELFD